VAPWASTSRSASPQYGWSPSSRSWWICTGRPRAIRCDNGPELTSEGFTTWCQSQDIALRFIQPGKPDQNAYIERFNRPYREEVLDAYLFDSLAEVRELTAEWLEQYNEIRPHDALGSLPPARYRERMLAAETPVRTVN
jgi:putative transposase